LQYAYKFEGADREESNKRRYTKEQRFRRKVTRDNAILQEEFALRD